MKTLGRYRIMLRVATGGMAEIFLGCRTGEGGFEKLAAVKRILPHLTTDETFVEMFMDEARITATLSHGNIAQIFEFGRAGRSYFIAMEYVPGLSLRAIMGLSKKRQQPAPPGLAAYVLTQVCAALAYAHERSDPYGKPLGIIHRDISPSNVLLSFSGEVKLIDFGIAKAARRTSKTAAGELKGKYAYMSPEQAGGEEADRRSDIFSAGVLLYELLSNENPFRAHNDLETLAKVRLAQVPLPTSTLRGSEIMLYEIATRAMHRDPAKRFDSAGEMQEALERYCSKAGFGSRQLAKWIAQAFPREEKRQQEVLRDARERLIKEGGLIHVPTDSQITAEVVLDDDDDDDDEYDGHDTVEVVPSEPLPVSEPPALPKDLPPIPLRGGKVPRAGSVATPIPTGPPGTPTGTPPGLTIRPQGPPKGPVSGKIAVPVAGAAATSSGSLPTLGMPPGSGSHTASGSSIHRRQRNRWFQLGLALIVALVLGLGAFVALRPAKQGPPLGSVRLTVRPQVAAEVYVDGELHGALSAGEVYLIEGLLAGKHRIKIKGASFPPAEELVEVVRGRSVSLQLTVNPGTE
jgi:eukaryotic-like serine/threonine-protein kinase